MCRTIFWKIAILSLVMSLAQACRPVSPVAGSPTAASTAAPQASDTPVQPTLSLTLPATFTPTIQPSPTSTTTATLTPQPFLPAGLAVLSPQNSAAIQLVGTLADYGAGVIAFSPNGRQMAAGFFRTNIIKTWDLASGQTLLTLSGHSDPRIISYLAYSPDGARLVSSAQAWDGVNDSIILWDAVSGRELQRFTGVLGAISPNWQLLATSQREKEEIILNVSNLSNGKTLVTMEASGDIYDVVFSPDGSVVAAKMYDVFQNLFSFWSVENGRLQITQYDWIDFSYSPDGRYAAALVDTGSGTDRGELNIHDGSTFAWIRTLAKDADSLWYSNPAFSPDGSLVAASLNGGVTIWETQTWTKLAALPASGPAGLNFSPDGRLLVVHTMKGPIQFYGVAGR